MLSALDSLASSTVLISGESAVYHQEHLVLGVFDVDNATITNGIGIKAADQGVLLNDSFVFLKSGQIYDKHDFETLLEIPDSILITAKEAKGTKIQIFTLYTENFREGNLKTGQKGKVKKRRPKAYAKRTRAKANR